VYLKMKETNYDICLYGATLFDGERIIDPGGIVFDRHQVLRIFEGPPPSRATVRIEMNDCLIAPGLVDLHSDALEKCIEMRPGVFFDAEFALQNLDRRVAASGITTFCHAICFADNELGLRSPEEACKLVDLIRRFNDSAQAAVHHLIHARFEVGSKHSMHLLEELIRAGRIDILSIMDHTPGQGQFKTLQAYLNFYQRSYNLNESDVLAFAERKQEQSQSNWQELAHMCRLAQQHGIPLFSHDDDTPQKIDMLNHIGIDVSEFPITMEAAQAARHSRMQILMGAPNLIRDQSTNGHLKASQAILRGLCDGFVSDYYPECLLQAPFAAHRRQQISLSQLLPMVTSAPARLLKTTRPAGRLYEGGRPDLIVIQAQARWVRIHQTWVDGRCVFRGNKLTGSPLPEQDCSGLPGKIFDRILPGSGATTPIQGEDR
jgi:alpha-D-ribose 1-methylphosphonate 5-triphosphate diphosphatase